MNARTYLAPIADTVYLDAMRDGLAALAADRRLRGKRVFIKPNLTFPVYRPGVMTSPECVEALLAVLSDFGCKVTVGEADSGGYNRFNIDDVMRKIGLVDLARKYGAETVNLSRLPRRELEVRDGFRTARFPFPEMLLDGTDMVISVAVPKIHMNSLVSMTVKNLWGCIPEPSARLRLHPHLGAVLHKIVESLPATIGIVDGRIGLNRSGPMKGDPVPLGWLMVADNLYAADALGCRLMQLDPLRVRHLRQGGVHALEASAANVSMDWKTLLREPFYLKRAWTDYPGLWAFHSRALSYLFYFSPLADALHKLLYLFREPFYDYDNPDSTAA
jgi:uncharacterized protein (DUF362 family)